MKEMKNPIADEKKNKGGYTSYRVYHGGGWFYDARYMRVSFRDYETPALARYILGFRIVRNKR